MRNGRLQITSSRFLLFFGTFIKVPNNPKSLRFVFPMNFTFQTHIPKTFSTIQRRNSQIPPFLRCVARNPAGEDRRDFELRFLEEPRIDDSNVPHEQTFIRNRSITLSCPASGSPEPTIVWLRDGHVLGESSLERIRLFVRFRNAFFFREIKGGRIDNFFVGFIRNTQIQKIRSMFKMKKIRSITSSFE
jgi:hypothetical protein